METNCKEGISRIEININTSIGDALILKTVRVIMRLEICLMAASVPFYDPSLILLESHRAHILILAFFSSNVARCTHTFISAEFSIDHQNECFIHLQFEDFVT